MKRGYNQNHLLRVFALSFMALFIFNNNVYSRTLRLLLIEMNGRTDEVRGLSGALSSSMSLELGTIASESCFIYISDGSEPYHTSNFDDFNDVFVSLKEQGTQKSRVVNDKKLFWQKLSTTYGSQSYDAIEIYFISSKEYIEQSQTNPSYWFNHLVKEVSLFFDISESSIKMNVYIDEADSEKSKEFIADFKSRWNFGQDGVPLMTFSDNLILKNVSGN